MTASKKLEEFYQILRDCSHNRYTVLDAEHDLISRLIAKLDEQDSIKAIEETIDHCFPLPKEIESEEKLEVAHV